MSHLTLVVSQHTVEPSTVRAPGLLVVTDGVAAPGLAADLRMLGTGLSAFSPRGLWERVLLRLLPAPAVATPAPAPAALRLVS